MSARRALCLNVTYEPIGFIRPDRAARLVMEGRVELLEKGKGAYRSSSGVVVPEPIVVKLRTYAPVPKAVREGISSRVLFARDKFTCQYCGKHESDLKGKSNRLTIDHIKPRAQGGPHHWENVVTACYKCNIRKRDRTPLEANMKFVHLYKDRAPKKPQMLTFSWGGRVNDQQKKWIKAYYQIEDLDDEFEYTEETVK